MGKVGRGCVLVYSLPSQGLSQHHLRQLKTTVLEPELDVLEIVDVSVVYPKLALLVVEPGGFRERGIVYVAVEPEPLI